MAGASTEHMTSALCNGLSEKPGTVPFAQSLRVLIHESAHARGVRTEDCAEMWADLVVFDVLRRFYRVEFFSPLSRTVAGQVFAETLRRPSNYQWSSGSCG